MYHENFGFRTYSFGGSFFSLLNGTASFDSKEKFPREKKMGRMQPDSEFPNATDIESAEDRMPVPRGGAHDESYFCDSETH
jgi:hypothetical protein